MDWDMTLFSDIGLNMNVLNEPLLVPIFIIIITNLVITRNFANWTFLSLPIALIWKQIGLYVPIELLSATAIIFGISAVSTFNSGLLGARMSKFLNKDNSENKIINKNNTIYNKYIKSVETNSRIIPKIPK